MVQIFAGRVQTVERSVQMTITLTAVGLDLYMGFLHQPKYGKPALALDMIEEFPPLVVDSTVITVINTGEVGEQHFITRNGEVAFTPSGRKTFITALERRMNTEVIHPIFGYKVSYRRIMEIQASVISCWSHLNTVSPRMSRNPPYRLRPGAVCERRSFHGRKTVAPLKGVAFCGA